MLNLGFIVVVLYFFVYYPPVLALSGGKLSIHIITSPASLLREVRCPVTNDVIGHGIFKGVITTLLSPKTNKKMYRIIYDYNNEENITLQELNMLTTPTKKDHYR